MSRILIIEDEEDIARLEKDYLVKEGYEADICTQGNEGLQLALSEDYDLILLDVMLPETDGLEICRRIRMEKNTPVMIISAKKDDLDKITAFGLGADDYMTKPFSPREMTARVKAHIDRTRRLTEAHSQKKRLIEIRGLRIDQEARLVWVNGEEKSFTAREYALLVFLASHPNRVYKKEELFNEIWGAEAFGDISTVTVHIRKIREKIEFNPADPQYIETIWGVGYRFRV